MMSFNYRGSSIMSGAGHQYKLLYNGDIKELLQELRHVPLVDLRIEEPSLEEVFMHYYER